MTVLTESVFGIVDRIAAAQSTAAAWDALLEAARILRLPYAIAHTLPQTPGSEIRVALHTLPKGCLEGYFANRLSAGDLVLQRENGSVYSFLWDLADWPVADMTPDQRRWHDHCLTFGITCGVSVVSYMPGSKMALGIIGNHCDLSDHDRMAVSFAGQEFLHRLHNSGDNSDTVEWLSHRERQCLLWAAAGKTDWEIGQILSLSEKTVNVYINRAKSKFGVKSRAQAILKASKAGLIAS